MRSRLFNVLGLAALGFVAATSLAGAQGAPPPYGPPAGPVPACVRLETQLAAIDRGSVDPARAEQIRRYEDAAGKQQAELDRLIAQARRS